MSKFNHTTEDKSSKFLRVAAVLLVLAMFVAGAASSAMYVYDRAIGLTDTVFVSVLASALIISAIVLSTLGMLTLAANHGADFRNKDMRVLLAVWIVALMVAALVGVSAVVARSTVSIGAVVIGLIPVFGIAASFVSVIQAIANRKR